MWLRGFADMEARRRALQAFYGGPVWAEHGPAANVTMIDFDDVLLLAPRLLPALTGTRPTDAAPTRLAITVHDGRYAQHAAPGAIGLLETLDAVNTYPGLPVRGGDPVVVRIGRTEPDDVPALQRIRAESTGRSWLR